MVRNIEVTMYSFKDFFDLINDIQGGLEKLERTNKNA